MPVSDDIVNFECGTMAVEITSMRQLLNTSACKAFFKVKFKTMAGSIAIDNMRLVENRHGELFVAVPSHKKGEKYFNDVEVTEDLAKYMRGAAVKEYQEKFEKA